MRIYQRNSATNDWEQLADGTDQGWSKVAADTINRLNKVIWIHQNERMWELDVDANWNHKGGFAHSAGSNEFLAVEYSFNMGFKNDGIIGDLLG